MVSCLRQETLVSISTLSAAPDSEDEGVPRDGAKGRGGNFLGNPMGSRNADRKTAIQEVLPYVQALYRRNLVVIRNQFFTPLRPPKVPKVEPC